MKDNRTYYETLEIEENVTTVEIKKQYHRLVRKYHPDIAHDADSAHEAFIKINEAYKTLRDPIMRKAYDFGLREKREQNGFQTNNSTQTTNIYQKKSNSKAQNVEFKKNRDKAFSMFNAGKLGEALSNAETALIMDSKSTEIWELKGDIHKKNKDFDQAMGAYSKALQIEPTNKALKEKLMDTVVERNGKQAKEKKGFFGKLFG